MTSEYEYSGDVMDVLGQLFEAGATALDGSTDSRPPADDIRQILTSAETVATNKLPDGAFRDCLLDGCEQALTNIDDDALATAADRCREMAHEVDARR